MTDAPRESGKTRVLFFAEAVTLAHVARPTVLAATLDDERYDIHFAQDPRYRALFGELNFTEHRIHSVESAQFMAALAKGKPLYDTDTLRQYVREDLALIEKLEPDIIVGDFRISLAVSAVVAGVPYVAISNAYWCPYTRQEFPIPELPIVRLLGLGLAQWVFDRVRPLAFYHHTRPLNRVRREYGLPSLGANVSTTYTWADHTVYADVPGLFETSDLPHNHHFIGPILWSPQHAIPSWWGEVPEGRPIVYVTMGSSGKAALLPQILAVLGNMDVTGMVSTAGGPAPENTYDNIFIADYLPGDAMSSLASLVICNGGSPTTHQALAMGKPVIGIAYNLDQFLNTQALDAANVGILLRSDRLDSNVLASAVTDLLHNETYKNACRDIALEFREFDSISRFPALIEQL